MRRKLKDGVLGQSLGLKIVVFGEVQGGKPLFGLYQIKASAGSGKTHTLTKRFLELLTASKNLEEVVAITFTNNAADEMRKRIIRTLKMIALGLDPYKDDQPIALDKEQARIFVDKILDNLSNLNVRTIDSLLLQIVRTSSLQLKLNPDFTPVFSTEETIIPYLEKICEQARKYDDSLYDLLEDALRDIYYEDNNLKGFMAAKKIPAKIEPLFNDILLRLCRDLPPQETLKELRSDFNKKIIATAQTILDECTGLKKVFVDALNKAINGDVKFKSTYFNKPILNDCLNKVHSVTDKGEEAFQSLKTAISNYQLLSSAIAIYQFIHLGEVLYQEFMKSEASGLYLHTVLVPPLALAMFEGFVQISDALFRLGNRITHLLIDEFQDTSTRQWDALKPLALEVLAHEGSLTWVGDIKQSIFTWNGGNPKLFDGILHDKELTCIAKDHIHLETLPYNWRSCPAIVDFNNQLFKPLEDEAKALAIVKNLVPDDMPEEFSQKIAKELPTIFNKVSQKVPPKVGPNSQMQGYVEVFEDVESDDLLDSIATLLQDLHQVRPWRDFMILERSNDASTELANHLVKLGIPVVTENSLLLAQNSLIIQSLAFLTVMVDENNDLAIWTLLTGHIMAKHAQCADLDFEDFMASTFDNETHDSLAQILKSAWPLIWKNCFERFVEYSNFLSPYDLLQEWYQFFDVEERFLSERIFVRRFLELVHQAEEQNATTISNFLEYWDNYGQDEKIPLPNNLDACRILTIHKAKGLESKVVLLPLKKERTAAQKDLIYLTYPNPKKESIPLASVQNNPNPDKKDEPIQLAVMRNKKIPHEYYTDYLRALAENFHLLYVATTRACEELYILPVGSRDSEDKDKTLFRNLAAAAGLNLPLKYGTKLGTAKIVEPENVPNTTTLPPKAAFSSADWIKALKLSKNIDKINPEEPKDLGKLFHDALEYLPKNDLEVQEKASEALRYALWHKHLLQELDPKIHERLLKNLIWFLSEPEVPGWLEVGLREQSFMSANGKLWRCDLLVPTSKGYFVVDYKTGESTLEHHQQLRHYMTILSVVLEAEIVGVLVYLDKRRFQVLKYDGQFQQALHLADLDLDSWF